MSWQDNPYRAVNMTEYKITQKEYNTLFSYCQNEKSSQEEVRKQVVGFWAEMAKKFDFDPRSVSCVNRRSLRFEAVAN